jgi:uncharacterized phage protein (TIGR02218 family)
MKIAVADRRYRVLCCRIVPVSGPTVRLTDYPRDLTMAGGQLYLSTSGYAFSGYAATDDFAPSAIDLEGIAGVAGISRAAVGSGVFDGARVYFFATDWTSPTEDEEPLTAGIFGAAQLLDERYKISGVSLIDVLGQTIGRAYGAQCDKTFGSQGFAGCKVALAPNTVTGTLTHVTSTRIFRDSARSEAADIFGAGTIAFTTGPNAGLKPQEIKSHAADGTIELHEGCYYLPTVGDAYTLIRGCRKRLVDCQNRWNGTATFNNVANFGGFPHVPTSSQYGQIGGQT